MQVGQLTWTIVTICMIVAQLKFVAHNIFRQVCLTRVKRMQRRRIETNL
jgi:hypothetical protein